MLLARNPREEWELPGGRPDEGEASVRDVARREVREETGLDVEVGEVLLAELFEVVPGHHLMVVAVRAVLVGDDPTVTPSAEHSAVRWFDVHDLPGDLPVLYREAIGRAVAGPAGAGFPGRE